MRPTPRPGILDIEPYVGGEAHLPDVARVARLASNENPLGAGPRAREAYAALKDELHRYPDGASGELREAIGRVHGVDPARVVCGAGSDELISLIASAYAGPGDEVLYSRHGFLMYAIAAKAAGATPVSAPEPELRADVDALLARANERTRLVFLANPNNPTGTYLPRRELERLSDGLPERALMVVDAAYAEYVDLEDYEAGAALVEAGRNVVMTRTFSKIHGLAALRLGWAYGPAEVVEVLDRVRGPFNVNAAAQAAGAAALEDRAHVERSFAHNVFWRRWFRDEMAATGLPSPPAVGNFVLLRFGSPEQADAAVAHLKSHGVLVRRMGAYGLPESLRVAVGSEEEMRRTAAALRAFAGVPA